MTNQPSLEKRHYSFRNHLADSYTTTVPPSSLSFLLLKYPKYMTYFNPLFLVIRRHFCPSAYFSARINKRDIAMQSSFLSSNALSSRRSRPSMTSTKKWSSSKKQFRVVAKDFPKPEQIDKTENYRVAGELSKRFVVRAMLLVSSLSCFRRRELMRNARVDAFALERKRDTQRTKFYLYPFLFEIFLFETRNVECA